MEDTCQGCTGLFCTDCRRHTLWSGEAARAAMAAGLSTGRADVQVRDSVLRVSRAFPARGVVETFSTAELLEAYRAAYERGWNGD